ncbi:glycosyltransferase family protein [Hoeflea sp.]|uniref:glycosyltransferase family protein n=1 Tax=Hoeflea sp. TaxID=1940281 RepID=UPI003B02EB69
MSTAAHLILYSHDTFGLGHIRRNRKIARSLVDAFPDLQATIITGSGLSGEYASHPRIRFVEIDQVEKQPDGEYRAVNPEMSISEAIEARRAAIMDFVHSNPADIFIADKEPLGLLGELTDALGYLKTRGTTLILGLRDVLDEAEKLKKEWKNKGIYGSIEGLYDQIWIYGSEDFYNPLAHLDLPQSVVSRCSYTGYLYQPQPEFEMTPVDGVPEDYLLVTAGGGGDGDFLMNAVLGAYEHDATIPCPAVLLLGPFSGAQHEKQIRERANAIEGVQVIRFNTEPEALIRQSKAVIGMCGYNTFCEVVAREKRVLFVPRQSPRMEQLIRAERARELGLCEMVRAEDAENPENLASAIRALIADADKPGQGYCFDSTGLQRICQKVGSILELRSKAPFEVENVG